MDIFKKFLIPALILLFVLSSCSPVNTPPRVSQSSPVPGQAVQGGNGYPANEQSASAPAQTYPGPAVTQADPKSYYPASLDVPQPKSGTSVITGTLIQASDNQPYLAPTLILGKLVYANDPAAPPLVGYSADRDPTAKEDQTGKFVFQDIQPGKYAIVLLSPGSSTVLVGKDGKAILVEAQADKLIDLGVITIP